MTEQHSITPPPELVEEWADQSPIQHSDETWAYELFIAHQAARWGADQELEACCEWLQDPDLNVDTYKLRAARRPKPPSLKEQALQAMDRCDNEIWCEETEHDLAIIRRALEQLDD